MDLKVCNWKESFLVKGYCREVHWRWSSNEGRDGHGVCLRKAIRKAWDVVKRRYCFIMGNGRRVKFWKDRRYRESTLSASFPSLFDKASAKDDAWVVDIWEQSRESKCWSPFFVRQLHNWELEDMEDFLSILHSQVVRSNSEDKMVLLGSKRHMFLVKSSYSYLLSGDMIHF